MSLSLRTRMGIFGRTYGLMLGTVLAAEVLIFSAMVLIPPPPPPFMEYARLVDVLTRGPSNAPPEPLEITFVAAPPDQARDRNSLALAKSLADDLGLPGDAVRARLFQFRTPKPGGPGGPPPRPNDEAPGVVVGEFTVGIRQPDGRWLLVASNSNFLGEATFRIGLMLLATLAVVAPAAYLLARHSARPIERFAWAAEQLGRDPQAPPMAEEGPEEIRIASEAFNRMQRRLNSYIEERTTMVAAVAHDLRTPLMRMAFEIEDAPAPLREALTVQIREMRELTDAIMRYLRAEQSLHAREPVEIDVLVADVVAKFAEDGADVRIVASVPGVNLVADPLGLKSVLRNVIGNAVNYGRSAEVALGRSDEQVVITVCDSGPGLSDEDLKRVFQPFYRVEKSRNRNTGGVGLGLTVARAIIAAHGGEITLANRPQGGLKASIILPHSRASA